MQEMYLGEAVKERRINLGLSQEEVCEGICEPITLSRLENGKQPPTHNRIKALLQRLNMPDDRYYALVNAEEMKIDNAKKELSACYNRFVRASGEKKRQAWALAMEQLHRLEELTEEDDPITRQFTLSHRALLGQEDGPCSPEERLQLQLTALRLTVPRFDLEELGSRRYSIDETQLINQIARTYSGNGDHARALKLYRQLHEYVGKHSDRLSIFAPHFTLIAHNYARELGLSQYYHEAVEVAEQGKRVSVKYCCYEFLPGFLAIMGECYYRLGEEEKSKKVCVQAHYLYEVLEDERNLRIIDPDIRERFSLEFPV